MFLSPGLENRYGQTQTENKWEDNNEKLKTRENKIREKCRTDKWGQKATRKWLLHAERGNTFFIRRKEQKILVCGGKLIEII